MAAKKIQEFVKGKMTSPTVGQIHFNPNDDHDQSIINISNYRKVSESFEKEHLNESDCNKGEQMSHKDEYNNEIPSSTKSSPGSKPKWGSHIDDVKKNINNAVEDAYSAFNTLMKGDIKEGSDVDVCNMRVSKTMCGIDKMEAMHDISECNSLNKSLDDLSQRSSLRNHSISENVTSPISLNDLDCGDFNYPNSPNKNAKQISENTSVGKRNILPKKVQKTFIENYEFPRSRLTSTLSSDFNKVKWLVVVGASVLVISVFIMSLKAFLAFLFGAASCYGFLFYYGLVDFSSRKDFMSLPALRDLCTPVIPHIDETNGDDLDCYSSKQSSYSCWVNLLGMYNTNTYNINQCHVIHLDIEERSLRLRRPKKKIAHRATWKDGQHHGIVFTTDLFIDLDDVKIDLLPKGLVHKRLWSKKYPICISFPEVLSKYISDMSLSDILNFKSKEIYLFGRTCRDKEELFRRLLGVCSNQPTEFNMWNIVEQYLTMPVDITESSKSNFQSKNSDCVGRKFLSNGQHDDDNRRVMYYNTNKDCDEEQEPLVEALTCESEGSVPQIAEYVRYIAKFMPSDVFLLTAKVMHIDINYVTCTPELLCVNALLGRVFWDFLRGSHWVEVIRNKIQCKLKKIHLPTFMDELIVVDIHFGKDIPLIRKFGRPYLDSRGLWFDAEIAYTGGFSMILETKVNLFNLRNQVKKSQPDDDKKFNLSSVHGDGLLDDNSEIDVEMKKFRPTTKTVVDKTAAFVSSDEDSAESSSYSEDSGDERPSVTSNSTTNADRGGSSKRLIRWVDKIARSPYFIKAVDNKYVQRGMEMVSNTKLMLQVELYSLSGTLAINIPPPPSDRLWYGFRPSPVVKLSAKPKVGQKEISISKITDFIEKKLILEFQRVLVLPNMDDVPLPLLVNGSLNNYVSNFI